MNSYYPSARDVVPESPSPGDSASTIDVAFVKRLLMCAAPGVLFLLVFLARSRGEGNDRFTLFDDAMISMAYGRTLAETGEWVWFPGADRVQGFTNPLWTLWMTFLHVIGLEGSAAAFAVSVSGLLSVLGSALAVALVIRWSVSSPFLRDWAAAVGAGTVLFMYPLVFWSLRGMEVGLLALLAMLMLCGLLWLLQRWSHDQSRFGPLALLTVVGVLGIATRLDFAVIAAALGLLALLWAPNARERRLLMLGVGLPLVVAIGLLLAFQQTYYGDFLTNTYRLKMEGFGVGARLHRGVVAAAKNLPVLILVLLSLIATARATSAEVTRRAVTALSLVWVVTLLYSLWVGGDAWEWANMANRYIAVGLPAAVAAVFIGLSCLMAGAAPPRRFLLASLAFFSVSGIGFAAATNPFYVNKIEGAKAVAALLIASAALYVTLTRYWRLPSSRRRVLALVAGGLAVTCATSAIGGLVWIRDGGLHVNDDARLTTLSLEVQDATSPDAVIATVWAGAPGYYSARPMIDLLGKSDRTIATAVPAAPPPGSWPSTFYPGHNKWDYDHSVGQLRPDVVFQTWFPSPEDLRKFSEWGYVVRCWSDGITASYFLAGSPHVKWNHLRDCPGGPAS